MSENEQSIDIQDFFILGRNDLQEGTKDIQYSESFDQSFRQLNGTQKARTIGAADRYLKKVRSGSLKYTRQPIRYVIEREGSCAPIHLILFLKKHPLLEFIFRKNVWEKRTFLYIQALREFPEL